MIKNFILLTLFSLSFGLAPSLAQDKPANEKPPAELIFPDLWPAEIKVGKALTFGPANEVRVLVENRSKDSKMEGKIKIELVVIQADSADRTSYFAEVDGMAFGQKREALFSGIEVKNDETVRLLAIVDPEKQIRESNEANNRKIFQVWLPKPQPSASPTVETSPAEETNSQADPSTENAPESDLTPE